MSNQIIKLNANVKEGGFAIVIPSPGKGLATKLFKRMNMKSRNFESRPWEDDIRRATFQAEVDAYAAVMTSAEARDLVPKFHGVSNPSQVLDAFGNDVSENYLLDCCFTMELLPGCFQKLFVSGNPIVPSAEASRVEQILQAIGVGYIIDSSVRVDRTGQKIEKIIDFATRDAYHEAELKRLFGM